jgi:hypothetical protein
MSDWKKFAVTWAVSSLVGFYTVFVLMQFWNWFAVPLLNVPQAGYWVMFGMSMLFSLLAGRDNPQDPDEEKRWRLLYIVLDACVPEHKMEEVKEYVSREKAGIWAEAGLHIFNVIVVRTLALGLGFAVHLLA